MQIQHITGKTLRRVSRVAHSQAANIAQDPDRLRTTVAEALGVTVLLAVFMAAAIMF